MIALLVGVGFQVTSEASEEPAEACGVTAIANSGIDGFVKYLECLLTSSRVDLIAAFHHRHYCRSL